MRPVSFAGVISSKPVSGSIKSVPSVTKSIEKESGLKLVGVIAAAGPSYTRVATFLLTTGELPIGLQLNALGLISGKVPTNKISSKWTFTVQVEDENGCRAEKLYTLNGDFFIPKVFTPNGDGVNDIFMSGYRVVIFDRLGITIYEGDSGWDGTYKGKEAVPDIYFYKLYYETGEGESKVTTGYIGLER